MSKPQEGDQVSPVFRIPLLARVCSSMEEHRLIKDRRLQVQFLPYLPRVSLRLTSARCFSGDDREWRHPCPRRLLPVRQMSFGVKRGVRGPVCLGGTPVLSFVPL